MVDDVNKGDQSQKERRCYGVDSSSSIEKTSDSAGTDKTSMRGTPTYCDEGYIFSVSFPCVISVLKLVRPPFPRGLCADELLPLPQSFVQERSDKTKCADRYTLV